MAIFENSFDAPRTSPDTPPIIKFESRRMVRAGTHERMIRIVPEKPSKKIPMIERKVRERKKSLFLAFSTKIFPVPSWMLFPKTVRKRMEFFAPASARIKSSIFPLEKIERRRRYKRRMYSMPKMKPPAPMLGDFITFNLSSLDVCAEIPSPKSRRASRCCIPVIIYQQQMRRMEAISGGRKSMKNERKKRMHPRKNPTNGKIY
jgi:hypothetical protein